LQLQEEYEKKSVYRNIDEEDSISFQTLIFKNKITMTMHFFRKDSICPILNPFPTMGGYKTNASDHCGF